MSFHVVILLFVPGRGSSLREYGKIVKITSIIFRRRLQEREAYETQDHTHDSMLDAVRGADAGGSVCR